MARSRVYRKKSHHKRKGSKRPRTRRNRSRSRRMSQRGGGCKSTQDCPSFQICNTATGTCEYTDM